MVATVGRIRRLTAAELNSKLQAEAEARVAYYSHHPGEIDTHLHELDQEWDIERAIEMEAAATVLTGSFLGVTVSKKWFLLPAFASAMLLLHNVQGSYPLLPLFRRLGLRTAHEIAQERYALKALRGDFQPLVPIRGPGAHTRSLRGRASHSPGPGKNAPTGSETTVVRKEIHHGFTESNPQQANSHPRAGKHRAAGQRADPAKYSGHPEPSRRRP